MTPLCLYLVALSCLRFAGAESIHVPQTHSSNQKRLLGGTYVTFSFGSDVNAGFFAWDYNCWTSDLLIGTPPQHLDVYLSTMSADLWVTSGNCTQCNASTVFNKSNSDTFQNSGGPRIPFDFHSHSLTGDLVQDTVAIGSDSPPQVQNQTWGLMDDTNTVNLTGFGFGAGVMGFGFNSSTALTPFWQSLLQANLLQAPEMGFWLRRRGADTGGILNLGGRDPTLYTGDFEFHKLMDQTAVLTDRTYWRINISRITVGERDISLLPTSTAIFSIGSMFIVGPATPVKAIYAQIPGSRLLNDTGFYGFPCNTTVEITMSFDGRSSWPISTQHMNLGPVSTDSGICVGGILNKERKYAADDIWYVGAPFLRSVYTLFRFQPLSIGFANLSIDVGGTSGGAPRTGNGSGYTAVAPSQTPTVMLLAISAFLFVCFLP